MHQVQMLGLLELDVLSSIEVPFLPDPPESSSTTPREAFEDAAPSKVDAEQFDLDIFALKPESRFSNPSRNSLTSTGSTTANSAGFRSDKRNSHRNSAIQTRIDPIEESPKLIIKDLPQEDALTNIPSTLPTVALSTSPSQSSIRSLRSNLSAASLRTPRSSQTSSSRGTLASKLAPSWLFNPFRSGPSEPQTSPISASASPVIAVTPTPTPLPRISSPIRMPPISKPTVAQVSRSPLPVAIKNSPLARSSRTSEEESLAAHRASYTRRSPVNSPPPEDASFGKRRSTTSIHAVPAPSSSLVLVCNPSQPQLSVPHTQSSLARRWQHMFPQLLHKHEIKWKAITVPVCLPLTVEHFPSLSELELSYDVFSYDFVVDPSEMRSFLVKPPIVKGNSDDLRRAWALAVMRGMAAVRLAQGFQFVIRQARRNQAESEDKGVVKRSKSLMTEEDLTPKPVGAASVLQSTADPVYLSMTNEIHRISYTGEAIQVRRYVRRVSPTKPFHYQCLMWPKLGGVCTSFDLLQMSMTPSTSRWIH
jgi:hypothetical protein